ncbi:MAG: alpha-amylase, partial [Phototrophicales bacterium]
PEYGTMEDFRELVSAAHERGIAIVIDFVINHTSDEHPWFIASANGDPEYADWYIWREDNPGYRGPWGEQVWHRNGDRYYYGIFTGFQPDLNFENPQVTAAIYDIANFWLTDVGIDGFRVDAAKHIIEDGELQENTPQTRAWLADFNAYLDSVHPQALTIAEIFRAPSFIGAEYVRSGAADLVFAFDVSDGIISSVSQNRAQDIVRKLQAALEDYP